MSETFTVPLDLVDTFLRGLSRSETKVILCLIAFPNISESDIMRFTGLGVNTVRASLKFLVMQKLVSLHGMCYEFTDNLDSISDTFVAIREKEKAEQPIRAAKNAARKEKKGKRVAVAA